MLFRSVTDWSVRGIKGLRLLDRLGPRERNVILFTDEVLEDYRDLLQRTSVMAWFHKRERLAMMEKVRQTLGGKNGGLDGKPALPRKMVLLIEDSAALRGFLRLTLMKALPEAVVREAGDGAQVLSEITHNPIDLIFLDLDTPTLDGRAFLKMVHGDPRLVRKPVVALAARLTPDLLREFQGDRAVWFIEKPAEPEEITEVVWHFLRKQG